MSRSTVREALRLLASQNLIITTRGVSGGSFVAHPSPTQLAEVLATGVHLLLANSVVNAAELLEIRVLLEVPATEMAAARRTDEQLAKLRATLLDVWSENPGVLFEAHGAFHNAVAEASGNSLLEVITRPLYVVANPQVLGEAISRELWAQMDSEHRAILDAIERADVEGAREAALIHLDRLVVATHLMEPHVSRANPPAEISAAGGA